jgi:hypothetical protein
VSNIGSKGGLMTELDQFHFRNTSLILSRKDTIHPRMGVNRPLELKFQMVYRLHSEGVYRPKYKNPRNTARFDAGKDRDLVST